MGGVLYFPEGPGGALNRWGRGVNGTCQVEGRVEEEGEGEGEDEVREKKRGSRGE